MCYKYVKIIYSIYLVQDFTGEAKTLNMTFVFEGYVYVFKLMFAVGNGYKCLVDVMWFGMLIMDFLTSADVLNAQPNNVWNCERTTRQIITHPCGG